MANTYTLIASSTVGSSGASTIDFTSIPSTYTDLVILYSGKSNNGYNQDWFNLKFNNNGSSYSSRRLSGTGSAVSTEGNTVGTSVGFAGTIVGATGNTTSTFSNGYIYIPNYAGSNNKSWSVDVVNEINSTGTETITTLASGLWSNSSAINQITFASNSGSTIQQYSAFYLYGIKNS